MLELLAPCIGVSELLTPDRGVLNITSGRFFTTGSSLPKAETSAAGWLAAPAFLDDAAEFSAPAEEFAIENLLEESPSLF
jgi:hypothetical protein